MGWFKISKGKSLDRYYLFKLFGYGVFLHRIHMSDPEGLYHNHPWNGLSFIFGAYLEQKIYTEGDIRNKVKLFLSYVTGVHHRVQLISGNPIWTLFIHWPRCRQWSVVNDKYETIATEPWRGDEGVKDYSNV